MTDPTHHEHPLTEQLAALRLPGMCAAFREQMMRSDIDDMPFVDRLSLMIDREISERQSRALERRLKVAQLRHKDAYYEGINLTRKRGLDRQLVLGLGDCTWIRKGVNLLISGPCGTGKSWLSCAFGHKACLEGFKVRYHRLTRLLNELRIAHGENRVAKLYREFARMDLVILDDFGLASIDAARARDLLEIVDDRHGYRSVIVTSQYPLSDWHRQLGDPTIADAILDRLVHGAIRFELSGSSWRETGADSMTEDGKA